MKELKVKQLFRYLRKNDKSKTMKTKEEIIQFYPSITYPTGHTLSGLRIFAESTVLFAMQTYADQETTSLKAEIEQLKAIEVNQGKEYGSPFDEPVYNPSCEKCGFKNSENCNTCTKLNQS